MYEYSRVQLPLSNLGRTFSWHLVKGASRITSIWPKFITNPSFLEEPCHIFGVKEQGRTNLVIRDS